MKRTKTEASCTGAGGETWYAVSTSKTGARGKCPVCERMVACRKLVSAASGSSRFIVRPHSVKMTEAK